MSNPINHPGGRHFDVVELREPFSVPLVGIRTDEWTCSQCGARFPESAAMVMNYTCPNPCLTPLFDKDGNQHVNPDSILPSRY